MRVSIWLWGCWGILSACTPQSPSTMPSVRQSSPDSVGAVVDDSSRKVTGAEQSAHPERSTNEPGGTADTELSESSSLIREGITLLERGSLAYGAGGVDSENALTLFDRALVLSPDDPFARLQRARALLSLGRGEDALGVLLPLAATHTSNGEFQASLGIGYLSVGKMSQSLPPLRRAAALDPEEPSRFIVLGTAQMLTEDLDGAQASFRQAIYLDGNSARAHGNLGAALLVQGKLAEGRSHLERAHLLEPQKATYVSNLAYAEYLAGDFPAARLRALEARKLDPKLASAWLNLGLIQASENNFVEARRSFLEAQKLDPSDPRSARSLKDLDEAARKHQKE